VSLADAAGAAGSARLFTALVLPDPVTAALDAWGGAELTGVDGLRRLAPPALHVTLCFLGSRPVAEIAAIADACSVLSGQGRPDLRLGGPLWLPRRRPRVLAVGVENRDGTLARLQALLAGVLSTGGWYEPESRRFLAHVTVGRFGRPGGREIALAPPPSLRFRGSSVALLRSWPERGGSRYERLAAVSLRGG
jgi:2'-5' RNA ligase